MDEQFPALALQAVGYRSAYHGEKSYNGVAILSKREPRDVRASLCDEVVDPQARVIAATIDSIRVFSIYAPNGRAVGSSAYDFRQLCETGFSDTLRLHHKEAGLFSWWDYRMLSFPKNRGLRIDAILTSKSLAKKCTAAGIDREMRKGKEPSDHAPVWAEFNL